MAWPALLYSIPYPFQYGNNDPTVTATNGAPGFVYVKLSTPYAVYQKQDNGTTTNWRNVSAPSNLNSLGTLSSPFLVSSGASPVVLPSGNVSLLFLQGQSGPVTITPDPPFTDPNPVFGKTFTFIGTSDTNTVTLQQGSVFNINGDFVCGAGKTLTVQQVSATGVTPLQYNEVGSVR